MLIASTAYALKAAALIAGAICALSLLGRQPPTATAADHIKKWVILTVCIAGCLVVPE